MKTETYGKATLFQKVERFFKQRKTNKFIPVCINVTNDWNNEF